MLLLLILPAMALLFLIPRHTDHREQGAERRRIEMLEAEIRAACEDHPILRWWEFIEKEKPRD